MLKNKERNQANTLHGGLTIDNECHFGKIYVFQNKMLQLQQEPIMIRNVTYGWNAH